MSLEDVEKTLYEKNVNIRKSRRVKTSQKSQVPVQEVPHVWSDANLAPLPVRADGKGEDNKPFSIKKLIFFGIGFFVLVLAGVATFLVLSGGNKGVGVEISTISPDTVSRGVPFDVTISVSNNSDVPLRDARLEINLPSGLVDLGSAENSGALISESLGDIGTGAVVANKKFKLLPVGDIGSIQKLDIRVSYSTGGKTRFETTESKSITVREAGITVSVKKPDQVMSGGSFEIEVKYKNETEYDFPELVFDASYPGAFKFESASLNPNSTGNNEWRLGELRHGSTGTLSVRGHVESTDGNALGIPFRISASSLGKEYVIMEDVINLTLAPSPIDIQITANGTVDYIARAGDTLKYDVSYQNQSGIALADVIVKANVVGDALEPGSIQSSGYLDPITGVITWNASVAPELRLLQPGVSGNITFSVKIKDTLQIKKISDKNYIVRTNVKIDSPTVPYYMRADKTSAVASFVTKVSGLTVIDQQVFFRDSASSITNVGVFPPRVGIATEYTVHWIIRNYNTDVKNVAVHGTRTPFRVAPPS